MTNSVILSQGLELTKLQIQRRLSDQVYTPMRIHMITQRKAHSTMRTKMCLKVVKFLLFSFTEFPSWPDDFRFMFIGFTPRRKECISIYERFQYFDWAQAKLCWPSTKRSINVRWSDFGPIPGMRCTNITERSGRYQSYGWYDNYLCVKDVPYK